MDEEDSILRAKVAVEVTVIFHGGVYRDTDKALVSKVEVTEVTKQH